MQPQERKSSLTITRHSSCNGSKHHSPYPEDTMNEMGDCGAAQCGADTADEDNRGATESRT